MINSLTPKATYFIHAVVDTQPRIAVFDCDGTLWDGDAGEGFFDWELKQGIFPDETARALRKRYADYKAGNVGEDLMCGEMVSMHREMSTAELSRLASEYFEPNISSTIFPEMQELVRLLHRDGCEVWAVSSTNEWVIGAAMKYFDIPFGRILAAAARIENGMVTGHLLRVPSGEGKACAIREVVGRVPDAAFGNSRWDIAMLTMARHPFAVNPNPDLEATAMEKGWTIYKPESVGPRAAR
ncbi:MAG: HAD-IB family phosphatase [Acidobacteriales bacterium]|nr:HAD-IB family phosphatase [Terriglobales bacterium]